VVNAQGEPCLQRRLYDRDFSGRSLDSGKLLFLNKTK
jgi:hypothetical protein